MTILATRSDNIVTCTIVDDDGVAMDPQDIELWWKLGPDGQNYMVPAGSLTHDSTGVYSYAINPPDEGQFNGRTATVYYEFRLVSPDYTTRGKFGVNTSVFGGSGSSENFFNAPYIDLSGFLGLNNKADQPTAEEGTNNDDWMTSLRTREATFAAFSTILAYKSPLSAGSLGSADDAASIQASIDAASAGDTVKLPAGTFNVGAVNLKGRTLAGAGPGKTTLQLVGDPGTFISCAGSLGSNVLLTADAARGARQIQVATTSGISANDYIVLTDNLSYSSTDSTYKSGEACRVKTVNSGTVLTLYAPLAGSRNSGGSYTTANTGKINKLTSGGAPVICDMTLVGLVAGFTTLIRFDYCIGAVVDNVEMRDNGATAVRLHGCINSTVRNSYVDNLVNDIPGGHSGYGLVQSGPCDNSAFESNVLSRCRHGLSTIGGVTGYPHRFVFADNRCVDTYDTGVDTHDAGSHGRISRNQVYGAAGSGMTCRTPYTLIDGNLIVSPVSHGLNIAELNLTDVTVRNNTIRGAGGQGLTCAPSCPNLRILDNEVIDSGGDGISLFSSGTIDSTGLIVSGNIVKTVGVVLSNRLGIITTGSAGSTGALITNNFIDATAGSFAYGIRTLSLTTSLVSYNTAKGTFGTAAYSLGTNTSTANATM